MIEELKQKVSAKMQPLSRYRKDKNINIKISCLLGTKKFYNPLRQPKPILKNAPGKEEVDNFWREIYWEK